MANPEAVRAAAFLRHELGLGTDFVDVFEVIRRRGIELYLGTFDNDRLEGAHVIQDGRTFIFVNAFPAITRRRLTAAHELGHHELEGGAQAVSIYEANVTDPGNDPKERAAYDFARYFLMDPDGVRRLTADIDDPEGRVAAVASTFVTSIDATAIHLADLGTITVRSKNELLARIRSEGVRPSAFLRQFGYSMAPTPTIETPELDPRFVAEALRAYEHEWVSFAAFTDLVQAGDDKAREILAEHGLAVRETD